MESTLGRHGLRRAIAISQTRPFHHTTRQWLQAQDTQRSGRQTPYSNRQSTGRQSYSSPKSEQGNQYMSRNNRGSASAKSTGNARGFSREKRDEDPLLARVRIVPASPSYFTATPRYIDDLLFLSALLRKYQLLPRLPTGEAPRVAWKTLAQYKAEVAEPVRAKSYKMLLALLKSLNYIHPSLIPGEVTMALEKFKRLAQPQDNRAKPIEVDEDGISKAVGRRKSSSAKVYVVEGEGKVLINGKTLSEYFGRMHDRESAVWALKASQRLDKYNVWALVKGGGTTGQADAIALGLARALLAHEPDLKPALRRARVLTRDPRRVERKKPGKLKARKMPTWVKR